MSYLRCIKKRMRSHPLDRDPTAEMCSARFNPDRYNSLNLSTCADVIQWTAHSPNQRAMFRAPSDPTHHNWP